MLTGMYQPDEGQILIEGNEVHFHSVAESVKMGISMVYQERNLVELLTGAQNIVLNDEPMKGHFIDEEKTKQEAQRIEGQLNVHVPLDVPVSTLGAGEKQLVEIMRAIHNEPKILILDEPTASLGEGEIEPFLKFIMSLKETMGLSVIFISHKINEVFEISDEIAVLTDGKLVLQRPKEELTQEECIAAMLRNGELQPVNINSIPFENREEMLKVATMIEGHPDNAAPAIYGGLCIVNGNTVLKSSVSARWHFGLWIPAYAVKTSEARKVLKDSLPLKDAVGNISSALIAVDALKTFKTGNISLIMNDSIHEPYRRKLIRNWRKMKEYALNRGALAFIISGSGSTCLSISDRKLDIAFEGIDYLELKTDSEGVRNV